MENMQMHSPFKFLDPFEKKDKDFFFGRTEEVEKLYYYVNTNRLVLLYGISGTGKTSLVKCGLTNRLDVTDWMPFYIRRGKNINDSLIENLQAKMPDRSRIIQKDDIDQLLKALEEINSAYLRPLYLIFDQFEELLILGEESEKEKFIGNLVTILDSAKTQSCNLLFILREEYFALLDVFEQSIPGFTDPRLRLRIEAMSKKTVSDVIRKSCKYFNITMEDPENNGLYIFKILSEKKQFSLPYLQVYLDQLWRDDFTRSFPNGWTKNGNPPLEFTTKKIEEFGQIEEVLDRFLTEQKKSIQQKLNTIFNDIPGDLLGKVLDSFATEEGTKIPVTYKMEGERICLTGNAPQYLKDLETNLLTTCLGELEKSRILRRDEDSFEFAHDVLATLINKQRSEEQRRLYEIRRQILTSYEMFQQTQEYLTSKQVAIFEDAIPHLDEKLKDFFAASKVFLQQQAEQKRQQSEQKLKRARRLNITFGVIALLILILLSLSFLLYRNQIKTTNEAIGAKDEALYHKKRAEEMRDSIDLEKTKTQKALDLFSIAEAEKVLEKRRDILQREAFLKARYGKRTQSLIDSANSLLLQYPHNKILSDTLKKVGQY